MMSWRLCLLLHCREQDPKRVYCMSMEFLMGRSLLNALYNLQIQSQYKEAISELGYKLEDLVSHSALPGHSLMPGAQHTARAERNARGVAQAWPISCLAFSVAGLLGSRLFRLQGGKRWWEDSTGPRTTPAGSSRGARHLLQLLAYRCQPAGWPSQPLIVMYL